MGRMPNLSWKDWARVSGSFSAPVMTVWSDLRRFGSMRRMYPRRKVGVAMRMPILCLSMSSARRLVSSGDG